MSKQARIAAIAIIIIVGISIYAGFGLSKKPQISFTQAKNQDITQGVTADGEVQSSQDLSLAFQQGGTVTEINVKAGDQVKAGQVLMRLDQKTAGAAVTQAQAALSQAQANYEKLQNGSTSADLSVSQSAVDAAQTALTNAQNNLTQVTSQQNQLVKNAQSAWLNSNLAATPSVGNISSVIPVVGGAYTGIQQGQYLIKVYSTGSGLQFNATGLENVTGQVNTQPTPLGTLGLYVSFPTNPTSGDSWTVNIPNTLGSSYVANYNAYQAALQTQSQALVTAKSAIDSAQAALTQAQAAMTLKQTPARPEDLDAARAQVQAAQASLQNASSNYSQGELVAPIDGTITSVDTKVGQTVAGSTLAPGPDAVKMISADKFQVIVYLSQTDIGKIKTADVVNVNLSAYGSGVNFPATVLSIDPSTTVQNGQSSYKTTIEFNNQDDRIKEGMDASVIITDQTHQNVLGVPQSSVITNNNQTFVLVQNNGKISQTQVQTGLYGVDGNVEITQGLTAGEQVATFGASH